jgi:hypothetical protein
MYSGRHGRAVLEFIADNGYSAQVKRLGVPDRFIEHGTQDELYAECHYDAAAIIATCVKMVGEQNENGAIESPHGHLKRGTTKNLGMGPPEAPPRAACQAARGAQKTGRTANAQHGGHPPLRAQVLSQQGHL